MAGAAVVGLGELMLRLSPNPSQRIEVADSLTVHAAGSEGNVIAGLARLGVPAALVTALPQSPLGRRAAAEFAISGADMCFVEWHDGARIGTFFVEQGVGARPTSVIYDREQSAFAVYARWREGALDGARYSVVSGITPALSQPAAAAAMAMAAEARMRGISLVVDINHRARLWTPAAARDGLEPLLAQAAIVICSEHDAVALFDADPGDPHALGAEWAPRAQLVVITRGESGAIAAGASGETVVAQAVPTHVVDRLGMGDAFVAGLLYGLLTERTVAQALRAGAALASLKATVAGDFSLAHRDELEAALASSELTGVIR